MMNTVTGLVAIASLLLALAAAGGATKEQTDVNSPVETRATTSSDARDEEPPTCPPCATNHNETLVRDAAR